MTRGEETQEVPQEEGREVTENTEAQRDQEMILDPEAVVERERLIEESEAIEAAVIEAVEATPETGEGESIEIAEVARAMDETSFKVESPAPGRDEEPPKPPQGTMEEAGEISEILADTSFKVESSADIGDAVLDETSFKVESQASDQDPAPDGSEIGALPVPTPESSLAEDEEEPVQPGPASRDLVSEDEEEPVQPGPASRDMISEDEEEPVQPGPASRDMISEDEEEPVQPGPASGDMISEDEEEPVQPGPASRDMVFEDEELLDETSFKASAPQVDQETEMVAEEVLDQTSFKFFSPQPGQDSGVVDEGVLDKVSFKFFTPQTHQDQIGAVEISTAQLDQTLDGETGEILDDGAFKPVPADQADIGPIPMSDPASADRVPAEISAAELDRTLEGEPGEILDGGAFKPVPADQADNGPIPMPDPASADGITNDPLPLPSPESEQDPGDDDPGGSILIGGAGEEQGDLEQLDLTAEAAKEVEEYWEPPEMYLHVNSDGTRTIVDAAGNKLASPPVYQIISDGGGAERIVAVYPTGGGKEHLFEIPFYSTSLQGMKVHIGSGGQMNVLDPSGNIIKSPPILSQVVDAAGKTHIYGEYPGMGPGQKIEMSVYSQTIDPTQTFVYQGQDGQIQVVDSNGKKLALPPAVVNTFVDNQGLTRCVVSYLRPDDPSLETKVELSFYQQPQDEYFVHVDQQGVYSVVDSSGNPVDCPPLLTDKSVDENGVEHFTASYTGAGGAIEKQSLSMYSASIENVYIHHSPDGKLSVVDASGESISSPPLVTKSIGENGEAIYTASYPGGEEGAKSIQVEEYSAPIQNMFASIGQDGTLTVVDGDGKVVKSPPQLNSLTDSSGTVKVFASYPGETPVELKFYQPPSAHWDK